MKIIFLKFMGICNGILNISARKEKLKDRQAIIVLRLNCLETNST